MAEEDNTTMIVKIDNFDGDRYFLIDNKEAFYAARAREEELSRGYSDFYDDWESMAILSFKYGNQIDRRAFRTLELTQTKVRSKGPAGYTVYETQGLPEGQDI